LSDEEEPTEGKKARPSTPQIHSLTIPCPGCGQNTLHRVLHIRAFRPRATLSGVARCSVCKTSHQFDIAAKERDVKLILSDGPVSQPLTLALDANHRVRRDDVLEVQGKKLRVVRVETAKYASAGSAEVKDIKALWAISSELVSVKISLAMGPKTVPLQVNLPPGLQLSVGDKIKVEGKKLQIYGIRLRGKNITAKDGGGPAAGIQRIYARLEWESDRR
jgi:uncharacterized Zn finger protein